MAAVACACTMRSAGTSQWNEAGSRRPVALNQLVFGAPGASFMWLLVKSGVLLALCGLATTWLIFRAAPERKSP